MFSSLQNRVALVTGASRGIGKGIAQTFARLGAELLLVSRDSSAGERTSAELRASGARVAFHGGDVTDLGSMQSAAAAAVEHYGRLDILCANAGIFPAAPLADLPGDQWDEVFRVNVKGMLFPIR
jgi:3-oxoacyl-[acyl-carrier protein] reductase